MLKCVPSTGTDTPSQCWEMEENDNTILVHWKQISTMRFKKSLVLSYSCNLTKATTADWLRKWLLSKNLNHPLVSEHILVRFHWLWASMARSMISTMGGQLSGRNPRWKWSGRFSLWASYQIRELRVVHAPGMPRTQFSHHRGLKIPTCITARASRTCRNACRGR